MNRVPVFLLDERSGVWHRPDARIMPGARGFQMLCRETFVESAQAFREETRAVVFVCNDCEEEHESR